MSRKNIDKNEELAQSEPLSRKDKIKIALIAGGGLILIAVIVFVIHMLVFFGGIMDAGTLAVNTVKGDSLSFTAGVKNADKSTDLKGMITFDRDSINAHSSVDYGNRAVETSIVASGNDAYVYIESERGADNLHVDISWIRALLGKSDEKTDWAKVLDSMSTDELNLNDYYDAAKIDGALSSIKEKITSPFGLYKLASCNKSGDTYTVKTDMYKLMRFFADSMKEVFVSEKSYDNLIDLIVSEKKDLQAQVVTFVIEGKELIEKVDISVGGDDAFEINIRIQKTDSAYTSDFEPNPEICEEATIQEAYRTLLRSGLDTEAAYKEATMSLNAFAEFYSYKIVTGTVVIVYDEYGNDFRYIYSKKNMLEEIEYTAAEYSAWEQGGYVALDTQNLDSGKYKVNIYEPGETMRTKTESNDYNDAYLSALNASYQITSANYQIPEGAIFLVKQNGADFQFRYSEGNLYDVYEQYYYIIYTEFGPADLSGIDNLPSNVTLYIQNESTSDS